MVFIPNLIICGVKSRKIIWAANVAPMVEERGCIVFRCGNQRKETTGDTQA